MSYKLPLRLHEQRDLEILNSAMRRLFDQDTELAEWARGLQPARDYSAAARMVGSLLAYKRITTVSWVADQEQGVCTIMRDGRSYSVDDGSLALATTLAVLMAFGIVEEHPDELGEAAAVPPRRGRVLALGGDNE